jgi:hypothetical protein
MVGALRTRVAPWAVAVLVALVAYLAAPEARSEIFKCVAPGGAPLYQIFPCEIDSLGSLPSAPQPARPTRAQAAGPDKSRLPSSAPARRPEVRLGMSVDEVMSLLGEPQEMVVDEPPGGRVSIWRYADGKSVQFDHRHRVTAVTR